MRLLNSRLGRLLDLVFSRLSPVKVQVDILLKLLVLVTASLRAVIQERLPILRLELKSEQEPSTVLVEGILIDALGAVNVR